jgi:putative membrane protein
VATKKELLSLLAIVVAVMLWSWINPYDRLTWWLETAPVLIALPILFATRNNFPLTRLVYYLIAIHAVILVVGAHYTYARVPIGYWLQDLLEFSRNPYDRIGHLAQGFIPAMVAREIMLRHKVVRTGPWLFFLVVCFCLAFSAFYELIEWWAAVFGGDGSIEFLGTQGDVWDSQWDMFLALIGAITALIFMSGIQDGQILQVENANN